MADDGALAPTHDALIAGCGLPRLEARALLSQASGRAREWLVAHGDEIPPTQAAARFQALAARRRAGEPLAYLLGRREFFGRDFRVDGSVLIPRPDTEVLVRWALQAAPHGATVLDLGTGSGAIAVTLALERPDLHLTATDASEAALRTARENARRLGAAVAFLPGDWYDALPGSARFDLIVANPPYLAADDPHLDQGDLRHEPPGALTDGADGLSALARIIAGAPARLLADGWLGVEHGWTQAAAVRALLTQAGFLAVETLQDAEHRDRTSIGRLPPQENPGFDARSGALV